MDNQNAIARIFGSSKALLVLVVTAATFGALFMGRATWDQVEGLIKVIYASWMGAQAAEDVAKHIAAPRMAAVKITQDAVEKANSTHPPVNAP